MSELRVRTVIAAGQPRRVWEKGEGPPVGYLAGLIGLPRWTPFLDRLAERRRVVAPSLPGFHGGGDHGGLDSHLDWLLAARDLLIEGGLDGADLIGASVGGALAADAAAVFGPLVRRLALIAPLGVFDEREPVTDVFAQVPEAMPALLSERPDEIARLNAAPPEVEAMDWQVARMRCLSAAGHLLWPLCDTRLAGRLHRIDQPTLIVWGRADRVIAPSYADRFAERIVGETAIRYIDGAGHLADIDQPDAVAEAVLAFFDKT